jgi:hypothetical protein
MRGVIYWTTRSNKNTQRSCWFDFMQSLKKEQKHKPLRGVIVLCKKHMTHLAHGVIELMQWNLVVAIA